STDEITADLQERIAAANLGFDVTISSSSMDLSSMTGAAVSIRLSGNDLDGLRKATADIANIVKGIEGTTDVVSDADAESLQKEIKISVDKEKAILNSLTVAQVFQSVYGDISAPASATTLSLSDGSALDVYVKDENTTYNSENIGNIEVTGTEKQKVSDIATITEEETFKQIARVDQLRVTFVSATLLDGYETLKVNKEIEKALEKYDLPNGVSYELAGENESINESFNDLFLMLILAVIFIYLVMVAQFQSLKSPFIVMFTLPLAATGGLLALFLTGNTISVISLVGFVLLAGVIVNNGIVFVDYANQMRAEGMSLTDALVKTGKDRLRPILMTALTTIIAMFATVFDTGQGSEMIKPMALVNVGGILYGTLLTLFVVPSLYATFNKDKGKKINKKTNKK
ncbi:MAG: efflux RND transporter permease subunit, partial [Oscillospiraceae bacterium]|nr:efflux RND transporter permease subunit [Oscillospiraceae bacterium]